MTGSPIVKCSHCQSIFSADEFDSHKCQWTLKDTKCIPVIYFRDDSFGNEKIMTGYGLDGILYTFKVVPRKPIPLILPIGDEFSHGKKNPSGDEDFTESILPLYKL